MKLWKLGLIVLLLQHLSFPLLSHASGVVDVTTLGVLADGKESSTKKIQEALDAGSIQLFVPPGDYQIGSLRIPANSYFSSSAGVRFHIEGKAILNRELFSLKGGNTLNELGDIGWEKEGSYINFGFQAAGWGIITKLPLSSKTERVVIGNYGLQQYKFDVDWIGDTVVGISPDLTNAKTGFTRVMDCLMPASYGDEGIGPIYRRSEWTKQSSLPDPYAVAPNRVCNIDWYSLKKS